MRGRELSLSNIRIFYKNKICHSYEGLTSICSRYWVH